MNVAALSVMLSQSQVKQQANLSVMKMAMNTAEQSTVNMTRMMSGDQGAQQAATHIGQHLDIRV